MLAARALGLGHGAMSGFDNDKVDALFFAGTRFWSNFLCSLGLRIPPRWANVFLASRSMRFVPSLDRPEVTMFVLEWTVRLRRVQLGC